MEQQTNRRTCHMLCRLSGSLGCCCSQNLISNSNSFFCPRLLLLLLRQQTQMRGEEKEEGERKRNKSRHIAEGHVVRVSCPLAKFLLVACGRRWSFISSTDKQLKKVLHTFARIVSSTI